MFLDIIFTRKTHKSLHKLSFFCRFVVTPILDIILQNHSILANDLILSTIRKAEEASDENRRHEIVSDYKDKHGRNSSMAKASSAHDYTDANYVSNAYRDSSFLSGDSRDDIFTDEYDKKESKKRLVEHF